MTKSKIEFIEKDVQERIFNAALKEFSIYGLCGARIERISKAAKINKAMIFYYFSSKENLYKMVVKSVFNQFAPGIIQHLSTDPSPEEFVEKMTRHYVRIIASKPEFIRMIALELIQNPENITSTVKGVFSEIGNNTGPAQIKKLHTRWVAENKISEPDPVQFMLNIASLSLLSFIGRPFIEALFKSDTENITTSHEEFMEMRIKSVINILKRGMLS